MLASAVFLCCLRVVEQPLRALSPDMQRIHTAALRQATYTTYRLEAASVHCSYTHSCGLLYGPRLIAMMDA